MTIPNTCEENAVLQTKILLQLAYALGGDDAQIDLGAGVISPLQAQITINTDKISINISAISSLTTIVDENKTLANNFNTTLSYQVSTLSTTVSQNKTSSSEADTILGNRLTTTESDIKSIIDDLLIVNGAKDVVNSIQYRVDVEKKRAKEAEALNRTLSNEMIQTAKDESISSSNIRINAVDNSLQTQIDSVKGTSTSSLSDSELRIKINEDLLNDTRDEDDNLVKGLISRINDLETALNSLQNI